jgi:hypothetical protein
MVDELAVVGAGVERDRGSCENLFFFPQSVQIGSKTGIDSKMELLEMEPPPPLQPDRVDEERADGNFFRERERFGAGRDAVRDV